MTALLHRILPTVQKPARYTGGEYKEIKKKAHQIKRNELDFLSSQKE